VTLRWTPIAAGHLKAAHDYVAQDNVAAADATIDRILSAVEMLGRHHEMGRRGRVPGTRELVITGSPFVVAYRVRTDRIEILAVLHGARRWPDRL
jgi:toxin ParE1/3/4